MMTLADARRYVANHIVEGTVCPCCGQNARLYKQQITKPMAEGLALLHQIASTKPFPEDYIHTSVEFLKNGMSATERNLARLRHWELVESAAPGAWRLTQKGRLFLQGATSVPHAVYLFNRKAYGHDESKHVNIHDIMGSAFDLNKGVGK